MSPAPDAAAGVLRSSHPTGERVKLFPLRVRSIFRARRGRRGWPRNETHLLPAAFGGQSPRELHAAPKAAQPQGRAQSLPKMSGVIPTNDPVLDEMLGKLGAFLMPIIAPGPPPPPPPPVPPPSPTVSLASVTEHAVGIGNRRGTGTVGAFTVRALKGLQLDAVVRFQYWAVTPEEVDASVAGLQGRLRTAGNVLRAAGFLRLEAAETSVAESVAAVNDFWRKSADYRVLYEFQFEDNDGAEGLIARIPIAFEGEFTESMVVTDDMVRWDKVAAPTIVVRGNSTRPRGVKALSVVAFLPGGWDGAGVTVTASVGGDVHVVPFASVRAFVAAFTPASETVILGGNPYLVGHLAPDQIGFPVVLPFTLERGDFLRISYSNTEFDNDAVVYLRVL